MEITYRVYTPDKGLFADFVDEKEAIEFRDSEYHGPIVIVEDGEEASHF